MKSLLTTSLLCLFISSTIFCQSEKSNRKDDFDFWLGEWTIYYSGTTMAAGNSSVILMPNDAIQENYNAVSSGYSGFSLAEYDSKKKEWIFNYTDSEGEEFEIVGKLKGGKMKLKYKDEDDDGSKTLHKIEWEPNDDGTVTQTWEQKESGKKGKWETVFEGVYLPRPTASDK